MGWIRSCWEYFRVRKKYWLLPILLAILLFLLLSAGIVFVTWQYGMAPLLFGKV
ncbi:MAG: DUF5989 family protein [Desulfovibrio sp.]|jgi:hypothetical protein|nr:DUF5989 family protein [Desulfovibrio sp.]